jgi:signal recognition particle subunit SRP54
MLPGVAKMKDQIASANLDERVVKRQKAIIDSMTRAERRNPDILKASRKKRIASGSGTKVEDINKLLKMHRQTADMMKQMGQAKRGPMAGLAQMFGMGGGMGGGMPQPTPEMIEQARAMQGGGGLPPFPGAGGLPAQPPAGFPAGGKSPLPGLAPKLPGMPGLSAFNPFGGKKK